MKRNFIATLLIMPLVLGSCGDSSENAQTEASETNSSETAALVEKVENRKIPHASFKTVSYTHLTLPTIYSV